MHGMKLEPGHATVPWIMDSEKTVGLFSSVNLGFGHVSRYLLSQRRWLGNRAVRGDLSKRGSPRE